VLERSLRRALGGLNIRLISFLWELQARGRHHPRDAHLMSQLDEAQSRRARAETPGGKYDKRPCDLRTVRPSSPMPDHCF
jgi:hypothetical protein